MEPQVADYVLVTRKQELPPGGALGITLEEKGNQCKIRSLSSGGTRASKRRKPRAANDAIWREFSNEPHLILHTVVRDRRAQLGGRFTAND